jgi:hypothetical protein
MKSKTRHTDSLALLEQHNNHEMVAKVLARASAAAWRCTTHN